MPACSWDYVRLPPPALMERTYPSAAVEREEALAGRVQAAAEPQAAGTPTGSSDSEEAGRKPWCRRSGSSRQAGGSGGV